MVSFKRLPAVEAGDTGRKHCIGAAIRLAAFGYDDEAWVTRGLLYIIAQSPLNLYVRTNSLLCEGLLNTLLNTLGRFDRCWRSSSGRGDAPAALREV